MNILSNNTQETQENNKIQKTIKSPKEELYQEISENPKERLDQRRKSIQKSGIDPLDDSPSFSALKITEKFIKKAEEDGIDVTTYKESIPELKKLGCQNMIEWFLDGNRNYKFSPDERLYRVMRYLKEGERLGIDIKKYEKGITFLFQKFRAYIKREEN